MKKMIKNGDRTLVVSSFGEIQEIRNRLPSQEAAFAMDLIMADKSDRVPGAVVSRAFEISRLAHLHIKQFRMDMPFPFAKVYGDDKQDA